MKPNYLQENHIPYFKFPDWIETTMVGPRGEFKRPVPISSCLYITNYGDKRQTLGSLSMRTVNILTYRWAYNLRAREGERSISMNKDEMYYAVFGEYLKAMSYASEKSFKLLVSSCVKYNPSKPKRTSARDEDGKRRFKTIGMEYHFLNTSDIVYGMQYQMMLWLPWATYFNDLFVDPHTKYKQTDYSPERLIQDLEMFADPEFSIESFDDEFMFGFENNLNQIQHSGKTWGNGEEKNYATPQEVRERARERRRAREARRAFNEQP